MASSLKRTRRKDKRNVDYKHLNSFSSAVMYDTLPKRRHSKFYKVERIIERRKILQGYEYLIKWDGWPFESCSWEPSENLTPLLLRSYDQPPKPERHRLERTCRDFVHAVKSSLKSKSFGPIYVNVDLDVWRYINYNQGKECGHKGHKLYEKMDFSRFEGLPEDWFYTLNQHGEGIAIDFPIKAKTVLSWTPLNYVGKNGKLDIAPRIPIEKIKIEFAKRACNINNV